MMQLRFQTVNSGRSCIVFEIKRGIGRETPFVHTHVSGAIASVQTFTFTFTCAISSLLKKTQ